MRLLIAASIYPPEIGGPATYAQLLVERLPARGIEVELLLFRNVRTRLPGMRHVAYAWNVFMRARKNDLVFVQDTVSTGFPAAVGALFAGVPLLLRVPGDYAWEQGRQRFGVKDSIEEFQAKRYGLRIALLRMVQRFVLGRARAVIVPSEYFGRIVANWRSVRDLRVIYNSIDLVQSIRPRAAAEHPLMVSVGRFVPWKGFGMLIEVLLDLPNWRLVLIGDGPDRAVLEKKAAALGVSSRVLFTGKLSRAEVFGWYKEADAFVLNTSFESFSYQTAEALTIGIPIIATAIGSIPELVENRTEGVLVTPDDKAAIERALESVVQDPEAWKGRIEAGVRKAELFSPDRMLEKFVAACNDAV